jgi:hypothetical protein
MKQNGNKSRNEKKKKKERERENVKETSDTCCVKFGSRNPGTRISPEADARDGDDYPTYNFTLQRYQEKDAVYGREKKR